MIRLRGEDSAVMTEALVAALRFARGDAEDGKVYGSEVFEGGKVLTWDVSFGPTRIHLLVAHGLMFEGRHAEQAAAHVMGDVAGLIRSDE